VTSGSCAAILNIWSRTKLKEKSDINRIPKKEENEGRKNTKRKIVRMGLEDRKSENERIEGSRM
jgi:hypothetical protein